jgi:hypothetical protein
MSRLRVERCAYGGWANNLRLTNGDVELIVTLDVGPRIIRYAPVGGDNLLGELPGELGTSGETGWRLRGGHRLWAAPEDPHRTYVVDNGAVSHEVLGAGDDLTLRVHTRGDATFGLAKSIELALAPQGSDVRLVHRIRNAGTGPAELAVWALTVMAAGGREIIPLPLRGRHRGLAGQTAADFAPNLTMSLWSYTDLTDRRWTLGSRYLQLQHVQHAPGPTKMGLAHRRGWAGYLHQGRMFVKRFGYEEGALYPDGGVNFETYSDGQILEIETLSPLVKLAPGGELSHIEAWSLLADVPEPTTEDELESIENRLIFPRNSAQT